MNEPDLYAGEKYAGIILGKNGAPDCHLILLPVQATNVTWANAKTFAENASGELPTRREQSLLFANLKEEFEECWYWSSEPHASYASCVYYQDFSHGGQSYDHIVIEIKARVVRRVTI